MSDLVRNPEDWCSCILAPTLFDIPARESDREHGEQKLLQSSLFTNGNTACTC